MWLVALLLASPAIAQVPRGWWVVGHRNAEPMFLDPAFVVGVARPQSSSIGYGLVVDERGVMYTTLAWNWIRRILFDPTAPISQAFTNEAPGALFATAFQWDYITLAVTRSRLWALDFTGQMGHVNKVVNNQPFVTLGSLLAMTGITGEFFGFCTDGRDLYFTNRTPSPAFECKVWAMDLQSTPLTARYLTTLGPSSMVATLVPGRDGTLLAMAFDALYRIDTRSGATTMLAPKPLDPDYNTLSPYQGRILVAYDPWTDVVAIGPDWFYDLTNIYSRAASGTAPFVPAFYFPFFMGLRKLTNSSEQPFEYFGKGCMNALGREPRMGWQGLPLQGQSFTLTLRDAEPNGFAILWVGSGDTQWPGHGPLPFDAGILGAPGCRLLASPDMSYLVVVDGTGHASTSIPVPQNSALYGFEVYAQTASTSGNNALGFAASDAVVIRLR